MRTMRVDMRLTSAGILSIPFSKFSSRVQHNPTGQAYSLGKPSVCCVSITIFLSKFCALDDRFFVSDVVHGGMKDFISFP